ncbi:MAG: amidohydrolase [Candidatus Xenobiia bacterium LiM19]
MTITILKDAEFISHHSAGTGSLVVQDGIITEILTGRDKSLCDMEGAHVIELDGAPLLPGFIDTHTHFLHTGLHMSMIYLTHCVTLDSLLETLRGWTGDESEWVRGFGFDESVFPDRKRPARSDLDRVVPDRPAVIFRRDYHSCVLNSRAIDTLPPSPFLKEREVMQDGFFCGRANDWVRQVLFSRIDEGERISALKAAAAQALSKGITTVHALEGGSLFCLDDLEFFISHGDSVPLSIVLYPQIVDIKWCREREIPRIGGCLLIDGSFGSRTAAISEPYHDDRENRGQLYFDPQFLNSFVLQAHREGLQLSFHAIGDRAVTMILDAYEAALKAFPRDDHRHRIEHCELPLRSDIERIGRLGVHVAVQPAFEYLWGGRQGMYCQRLGPERVMRTNPVRELLDNDIVVGGGSDSDVTPMDPMLGIYSALTHPNLAFRVSLKEALDMYTGKAARFSFQEREIGDIEVGKRADLAVLSRNPHDSDIESIMDIEVEKTLINGVIVYERKEQQNAKRAGNRS